MDSEFVDLHIHTSASDGTHTPEEIVNLAQKQGLKAIAITDHDTIEGNEEAIKAGTKVGLEVIPGVEISVDWDKRPIHILGYYINWRNEKFASELQNLIKFREERNPQIIEKLNSLGLTISYDDVRMAAGEGTIGRPHFAQVIIEKGYVKNGDEAFRKYLQRGAPAYVDKKRLTPQKGIQLIKHAGGIAVLAHPFTIEGINNEEMEQFILHFKDIGIDGVEVFYSGHSAEQTLQLQAIAKKHNLLMTGGTDFHGEQKPKIHIGKGFGEMQVPYELVIKMKNFLRHSNQLLDK